MWQETEGLTAPSVTLHLLSASLPKNREQPDLTQMSGTALWPHCSGQRHQMALGRGPQTWASRLKPEFTSPANPKCILWKHCCGFLLAGTLEGPAWGFPSLLMGLEG